MMPSRIACLLLLSLGAAWPALAEGQTLAATPGNLRAYATIYSIGLEWDLIGDADHDATASVQYRRRGSITWLPALPLVRVDYNGANTLAGSVLFLAPGSAYDVRVSLADPDGGSQSRTFAVATRPVPGLPVGGRTFHVMPGSGGGDGSPAAPFRGVPAAQSVARAGDIFLLHAGGYAGRTRFDRPGSAAQYVVWKAAGDGEVLMNGIDIAASHIWLEGLTVRDQAYATFSIAAPANVVITRCGFFNNHYSIYLQQGGKDWYIADNTIVGDTPYSTESFSGEGIELNQTGGHTVAHNSITNVSDGISYPLDNVDIFGNDIFDTSDDGIEGDYGYANVRIWGNRIHNAAHNGISFQPQNGGPWYIIRNQIVGNMEGAFKFRTTDRFLLLHNTIVNWGGAWPGDSLICCNEGHLLRAFARNNLWISVQGGQIWGFDATVRDWRTDLDFDGFDWGTALNPFAYGGATYADLPSFAAGSGLEGHGTRVTRETCFDEFRVPGPPPIPVPPQVLTLRATCAGIDAGAPVPTVNDRFVGGGPDLGAYELGDATPQFGPRSGAPGPETNLAPRVTVRTSAAGVVPVGAPVTLTADASDDDGVVAQVDFMVNGSVVGSATAAPFEIAWTARDGGPHLITALASDDDGATAISSAVPVATTVEIVLYASDLHKVVGDFQLVADASAAGGRRLWNPNRGQGRAAVATAPSNFAEVSFYAEAGRAYHLWLRGKAEKDWYKNDSCYLQFSGTVNAQGAAVSRIGTTAALSVSIEDRSGAGVAGWGWQDQAYGGLATTLYFASSGLQTLRVQPREDGLSIDQITLSPATYLMASPGGLKNDSTILAR